jgi:hypothetical protein
MMDDRTRADQILEPWPKTSMFPVLPRRDYTDPIPIL